MKRLVGHTHTGILILFKYNFLDGIPEIKTYPVVSKEMQLEDDRLFSTHYHELVELPDFPDVSLGGKWHLNKNTAKTHKHYKISASVHLTSLNIVLIII